MHRWRFSFLLLLLLVTACQSQNGIELAPARAFPTPIATPVPQPAGSIQLFRLTDILQRPVYLTHAGDERLFIVEQHGTIRIFQEGELLSQPFLDVSEMITIDGTERGLLGLAFHPDYDDNGYFYIVYTNLDGDSEVSRYTVSDNNPNVADPTSQMLLLHLPQPYGNHNGGQLAFGPEGYLYLGFGDGGAVGDPFDNAQDKNTLLGGILRLDVDSAEPYAIPDDNPYAGQWRRRGELWAMGLRNPWAFSFDRLTGDMFIADVGQEGPEELNWQPAGSPNINYGWPILEGPDCYEADTCDYDDYESPIWHYQHGDTSCAIIGGHVYRGQEYPQFNGNYFFADFCAGTIWSLVPDSDGNWHGNTPQVAYQSDYHISSIGEDVNGELYVLYYYHGHLLQIQSTD